MPFPATKLRVFPNPWTYIDHLGRPAGRLPFDSYEHSPSFGFVGAALTDVKEVQKANTMRVANYDLEVSPAKYDHRVTYSKEAVSIPNTAYYRDAVKRLDLIAADQETASLCGLKFEAPASALSRCKAEAIAKFDAETDANAHARFGAVEPNFAEAQAQPQSPLPAPAAPAKAEVK